MLPFVLALVTALHPNALRVNDARAISRAIAEVAASEEPLPGMTRERTAALLVAIAWNESRFRMSAVGDHGRAFCAMQIHDLPWLANSPIGCMRVAMKILRLSIEACPDAPLASYSGGCHSRPARAISAMRLRDAEMLETKARAMTASLATEEKSEYANR